VSQSNTMHVDYWLTDDDIQKSAAAEFAPGITDPKDLGEATMLQPGALVPWVVQRHIARRAGPHHDIRLGKDKMLSFATKKDLPKPGEKITVFQQPLHSEAYSKFQGRIPLGYGAGRVHRTDLGEVLISEATPKKVKFTIAHKKNPEDFTLVRLGAKTGKKPAWYLFNTTETKPVSYKKVHYKKVPAEQVDKLFDPSYVMSAKIDGAAAFLRLMKDHVQVLSYRARKGTGEPIIHTHRMGLAGKKFDIPKHLQGKTLRGEIYGEREGKAIPAAELGGILNAAVAKSLREQERKKIKMRMALFGVQEEDKGVEAHNLPWEQKKMVVDDALRHLPKSVFTQPPYATDAKSKKRLWEDVVTGKLPVTREGVVGFPEMGGKPVKVKQMEEGDVFIRDIFPGEGKYEGVGAGGFRYSLTPEGPIVGKVGTGFSDDERKKMWTNPEDYIGRTARVSSQEQFPSGAWRAPSYIARHEDYPLAKAAQALKTSMRKWANKRVLEKTGALDPQMLKYLLLGTGITADVALNKWLGNRVGRQLERTPGTYRPYIPRVYTRMGLDPSFTTVAVPGLGNAAFVPPREGKKFMGQMQQLGLVDNAQAKRAVRQGMILYDPQYLKPGMIAHEAGHAKIHGRPWYSPSRFVQGPLRSAASVAGLAKTMPGIFVGMKTGSPILGALTGMASGAVTNLPTWINELQASQLANKYITESIPKGRKPEEQKRLLRRAYATYLLPGIVLPALFGAGAAMMGRRK